MPESNEWGAEAEAAVRRVLQSLERQQSAEESVNLNLEAENAGRQICPACGNANRKGNNFCASCGVPLRTSPPENTSPALNPEPQAPGEHHYHHHYHHHYFSSADGSSAAGIPEARASTLVSGRDPGRVRAPLSGPSLSRAEAGLRRVAQDWAQACNTRQLDDLVSLYTADAIVLRPNVPAMRGAAAIREFFVGLLDAGMSEVELDALRAEVCGDFGYEAGRCKFLAPIAMGKRREERGKYLLTLSRQANGDWKILADNWSADLGLGSSADALTKAGVTPGHGPRKT